MLTLIETYIEQDADQPARIAFNICMSGDLELLVRGVASGYLDPIRAYADFLPADELPDGALLDALTTALISVMQHDRTDIGGAVMRRADVDVEVSAVVPRVIYHLDPRPASLADEDYEELVRLVEGA